MKKIVILGSTGHIGQQTLEIIRAFPDQFQIIGLSANKNKKLLDEQANEFKPVATAFKEDDLIKLVTLPEVDLVIVAVVGTAGLKPTLAAIRAKKNVALATKEVMILAGELVMTEANNNKVQILPLDSEHSAIFQCLRSGEKKEVKKVILTMGKGKFAFMNQAELKTIDLHKIYEHPNWPMGNKITIDSATCLNKSFEVIEAKWLFDLPVEKISIVVHPEYICHSLVEFQDGSIIGEFGTPDMRRYIQYALFYPQRSPAKITGFIDLFAKKISFEPPPFDKFPGLQLGFRAIAGGGTLPAVMHGADDAAVMAFIDKKIRFTDIPEIIKKTMDKHKIISSPDLDEILRANEWGQRFAGKLAYNAL